MAVLDDELTSELLEKSFQELLVFDEHVSEVECSRMPGDNDEATVLELEDSLEAGLIEELGYGCSTSVDHCKEILSLFRLGEKSIAIVLATLSRTNSSLEDVQGAYSTFCSVLLGRVADSSTLVTWQVDVVLEAINQLVLKLDWAGVYENFDQKSFLVPDQKAFNFLISLCNKCSRDVSPLRAFCDRIWANTEGQLSFLKHAVMAPSDVCSFAAYRKQTIPESYQKFQSASLDTPWASLRLLEVLCRLAELGQANRVRGLLEYPSKHFPEILLPGLAQTKTEWNLIQTEYCPILFASYLTNSQNSSIVLHHLWSVNRDAVIRAVIEIYSNDSSTISRLLEICQQELKVLTSVLDGLPFAFAIELAALATRREYLNLKKWLNENLSRHRDAFFQACLLYLRDRVALTGQLGLPLDILSSFFKVLYLFSPNLSSRKLNEELKEIHTIAARYNPRLTSVGAEPVVAEAFSGGIETEANSYFDKIFNGQLTIDDVIEMLQRFSTSAAERERDVCACMIRCLFDEYQFFPRYPDRELEITAVLFGKLVKHGLVTAITLGIALRLVLDALRKPLESKMFSFGMTALRQFMERLVEWPQYCNHLLQISHLRDGHPDLFHFIERALQPPSNQPDAGAFLDQTQASQFGVENVQRVLNSSEVSKETVPGQSGKQLSVQGQEEERPRSAGSLARSTQSTTNQLYDTQKVLKQANQRPTRASSVPVRHLASTPGFGHALNIETLVAAAERRDTPIENPSSDIEDKVGFIINNISANNVETKAKECLEIVEERYFPWFAQYMVMKRASIEHNFHDVYLKFLDHINSKALDKEILKATYENCKVLLRSELIKSSSEERSLLKNLGLWLGKLTIGRNKCLRAKEIDPKPLIVEAYEKGLMIAVIPFTSKILEPCKDSVVYRPPNPWTMSILNLLAEICTLPNLKMNLKFEVEVIFRHLSVELKDLKPTQLLKGRAREVEGNPDFATKEIVPPAEPPVVNHADFLPPELAAPTTHTPAAVSASQHVPPTAPQDDEKAYENFPPFVDRKPSTQTVGFSPHFNAVSSSQKVVGLSQQQLQRLVPTAMERAIRDIMPPVVERSVTIAWMTTRELIMKDFALESDDNRTMHSANLMIASLAGRLAHVTCKEPLRVAMTNQMRQILQAANVSSEYLDQAIHFVTNENLERGCELIEKNATEKALRELEDGLGPLLTVKRNQREALLAAYAQGGVGRLPEALRPKPGRLSPGQQRVFEDFAALSWQGSQPPTQNVHSAGAPGGLSGSPVRLGYQPGRGGLGAFPSQTPSTAAEVDAVPDALEARTPSPSFVDGAGRQNEVVGESVTAVATPELVAGEGTPNKLVGAPPSLSIEHEQSALDPRDEIRREPDPTGLRDQAQTLFDDWIRLNSSGANDKAHDGFISQLLQKGLLKGDDVTDRFFRFLAELAVARCHLTDASQSFAPVDMYATFVVRLVKYFALDPIISKVNLLNRVLNVTVRVIQKDADEKKTAFQSQTRIYFRLFVDWFMEFSTPDPLDSSNFQVLAAFGNALMLLQPLRVPGLSFVWLELISHRMFMPKQLLMPSQKGWPLFQRLLVALFKFMDPYLRNAELTDPVRLLYKGTLRVLLVLLHDFPEFLCEYHFSFCDVIPPSCIQMRNLILSAFPRNMRLPDPFTPNLKVDLLAEIRQPPKILSDVEGALKGKQLKAEVDEYIKTRQGLPVLLADLKPRLLLPQQEAVTSGTRYNVPLINSLVLYVGMQGIQQMQVKTQQLTAPSSNITESASMDIFKRLISDLDTEGRYLFLNAIANQLRYPNNHTHYFSCVLLFLFAEAGQEIIQEQITRVLLERLIVNRPHPWGLLITFIELIKNTRYSFWKHSFVRCAPEIERLFDSVARSCMGNPKPMEEDLGAGVPPDAIKA